MNSSTRLEHLSNRIKWGEDTLALVIFSAMALLPLIESFARLFNILSIPASQVIVQHFTLWIGFLGAVLAARQNKLLSLTIISYELELKLKLEFEKTELKRFWSWIFLIRYFFCFPIVLSRSFSQSPKIF